MEGMPRWRAVATPLLFTLTALVGAALLFVVQPMIARLLLPSYGGSATVWSTSSLFFQMLLLLGYLYTHATTRRLGSKWQPPLHILVLVAPLVVLPVALPADAVPAVDSSPVLWLLRSLALMIGLPFLVVSTTGPLLQRWYSWNGAPRADDPYFLFAASNLGSFGGLLLYPFVVEPSLTLQQQRMWWSWGFVAFAVLTAACGLLTLTTSRQRSQVAVTATAVRLSALGRRRIARWTTLAFLPSAMMLAVTAHISTDVAAVPLLWVVPLAIYLGTFVAAFARSSRTVPTLVYRVAVVTTLSAAAVLPVSQVLPAALVIVLQMLMLASVGYAAHAQLAAERPDVEHLTGFYLVVAAGGAVGGLLNGIVAPLVFDRVWEYLLVIVMVPVALAPAKLLGLLGAYTSQGWVSKVVAGLAGMLLLVAPPLVIASASLPLILVVTLMAVMVVTAWVLSSGRLFVSGLLAILFAAISVASSVGSLDYRRTFFGSYRVGQNDGQHTLTHGTTMHGSQWVGARRFEPTTYYSRSGPLGAVFQTQRITDVGVIGMGVGTVAAYARPGQTFKFVEIDPEVVDIARDPRLFTYLRDSKARMEVTVGDGRLEIEKFPRASLDLLIVDAFSSDAIPVHLLTLEAIRTYADRLRPGGLLAVHISNRIFDLRPVVRGAADHLGWAAIVGHGRAGDGATASEWVILSADASGLAPLEGQPGWEALPSRSVLWTDDYSSILSVLR
jgi:SAM-dependent methyltransferase